MKQSSGFVELHNGPPGVKKKCPQEFLYALGVVQKADWRPWMCL